MPVKVNVGLSKKVGLPDYGSLGATCTVEFELDGSHDTCNTDKFEAAVQKAYANCSQAIESQLAKSEKAVSSQRAGLQHVAGPVNRIVDRMKPPASPNEDVRMATPAQLRAIYAITNRTGISVAGLLEQFQVTSPDALTIRNASRLIDQLKHQQKGGTVGSPQPA